MALIRVYGRDNGAGLSRDMALVVGCLRDAGLSTEQAWMGKVKALRWLGERMRAAGALLGERTALQISLERVSHRILPLARRNVLIPNPEWFSDAWLPVLPRFDCIACKTRQAVDIFTRMGCPAEYIGFTSEDRRDRSVARQPGFFHLAGRSSAKGTEVVLRAWRAHPEWPMLTVVQAARKAHPQPAPNINHIIGYVDDARLRQLQNQHVFHLCPSEAEGFGHYLMEAMSVGAVVITTDGAPMNELVRPDRGILIPPVDSQRMQLGVRYRVDVPGIERAVHAALALDAGQVDAMSQAGRAWFEAADREFRVRLPAVMARLAGQG